MLQYIVAVSQRERIDIRVNDKVTGEIGLCTWWPPGMGWLQTLGNTLHTTGDCTTRSVSSPSHNSVWQDVFLSWSVLTLFCLSAMTHGWTVSERHVLSWIRYIQITFLCIPTTQTLPMVNNCLNVEKAPLHPFVW